MTTAEKRKASELEEDSVHKNDEIPTEAAVTPKKKNKKKKKKNKSKVPNGNEAQQICNSSEANAETGKRKLPDLEEDLSKKETEGTDAVLPPKKKKKRNKSKAPKAEKNGESQQIPVSEGGGVPVETDVNGPKVNDSGSVSPQKVQENDGSCQEGKKKKKKKKKKQSTPAVTSGSAIVVSSVAEGPPFSSLQDSVSEKTLKAITDMGFTKMTPIQEKAIPPLLEGKDVRGTAKTGSGKTLAFIIPVVERLSHLKFTPADGTGALIISPTRELSMQTFDVLKKVIKDHSLTSGILIGGVHNSEEAEILAKGINVLVATPGRLLNHLKGTPNFITKNLACLVLDEADRILDVGFEKEVNAILELLPKKKQTMFFSATKDKKVDLLARLSLNDEPVEVEGEPLAKTATVDGLEQAYVMCPPEKKVLILHNFLEKNKKKKIMVFFSTCNAVKFYCKLLNSLGLNVMDINGKNRQGLRTQMFYSFSKLESGILLCTDVAARGWDIPAVDWIVQFDPPRDPKEYIHRVGRTARAGGKGKALLFIREEEKGLLGLLKSQNVHLQLENFTWDKSKDLQLMVEKTVRNTKNLKVLALKALASHFGGYFNYNNNEFLDITKLDLKKLAKCFGFETLPRLPNIVQRKLDEALGPQEDQNVRSHNAPSKLQHRKGKLYNTNNKPQYQKGKSHRGMTKPQHKMGKSYKGVSKVKHQKGKFPKGKKAVKPKEATVRE